jgi:hypothetical protein
MNGNTGGGHRGRRRAGALAAVAAVTMLATACGIAPSPRVSVSVAPDAYVHLVALAQCMRSHGAPKFPDPSTSGTFSDANGALDLGSSQVQRAYGACRHLLPGGGPNISQLQQEIQQKERQALPALLRFARCVRGHGEPGFPDPTPTGLDLNGTGIDPASTLFQAAVRACQRDLPAGMHMSVGTRHVSAG